jgi:GGDEF domain-containing protein
MRSLNRVNLALYMAGALTILALYQRQVLELSTRDLVPSIFLAALYGCGVAIFVRTEDRRSLSRTLERVRRQVASRLSHFDPSASFSSDFFLQRLEQECFRARRYGLSLTLLVVRCHPVGGKGKEDVAQLVSAGVLTHVATAMRREDVAGRLGELEFGIYLPHTALEGARQVQARLQRALESHGPGVGIAVFGADGEDAESLVRVALRDGENQWQHERADETWNDKEAA